MAAREVLTGQETDAYDTVGAIFLGRSISYDHEIREDLGNP